VEEFMKEALKEILLVRVDWEVREVEAKEEEDPAKEHSEGVVGHNVGVESERVNFLCFHLL
jgi:hypothetical protein